tara:strand:- start:221 stop:1066 length:846 start_codon:yes stop_codon:yes gene_type:complete
MKNILLLLTFASLSFDACEKAMDSSRITAAGGSITEIIYFLEQESRLIAVDVTSNYPKSAMNLPSIGYVRALSAEGVLSLDPTLIIGENDMGPPSVIDQINRTNVETRVLPEIHSASGIIQKIECVGQMIGMTKNEIDFYNNKLLKQVSQLENSTSDAEGKKIIYILSMQSGSPLIAGSNTSGDGLISLAGGINPLSSFEGWKPVGTESIIQAEPDLIIISERGLKGFGTIEELSNHPALYLTPAAQNNNILALDGMASLGFGPRTIDTALQIAKILNASS